MDTVVGSITFRHEDSPSDLWHRMINGNASLSTIDTCELVNPMTGDAVTIPSPPNLLAEVLSDGKRVGIVRLPKGGTEFEVHFEEANRPQIESVLKDALSNIDGKLQV